MDENMLDLDANNVHVVDLGVGSARSLIDDLEGFDVLTTALDEAQGMVFTEDETVFYIVIKITK